MIVHNWEWEHEPPSETNRYRGRSYLVPREYTEIPCELVFQEFPPDDGYGYCFFCGNYGNVWPCPCRGD